jgi:hypothetical protein
MVVLPAPLPAGGMCVQDRLHLVEQLAGNERRVGTLTVDAFPTDDACVDGVLESFGSGRQHEHLVSELSREPGIARGTYDVSLLYLTTNLPRAKVHCLAASAARMWCEGFGAGMHFLRGLLVGLLVFGGGYMRSAGSAEAVTCTYTFSDVVGRDDGRIGYTIGNHAQIYTNNIVSTPHGIVRAILASTGLFDNNIEFGWSMGPDYPVSAREWFIAWTINGQYHPGYDGAQIEKDQFYAFKLQDSNRDTVWNFYFRGNLLNRTVDHNFSDSSALSLSEVETDCDTGWAEFKGLSNCISGGCSTYYTWLNLKCRHDDNEDYHLDKDTNAHHYVKTGQTASGCAGATGGA